jgi:hypothetical protein
MIAGAAMKIARPRLRRLAVIALAMVSCFAAQAAELKHEPVDEAWKDPTLVAFRKDLLAAVKRHDVKYVVARAARNIKLSFGGYAGRKTLREWLRLEGMRETYWRELEGVFSLGGVFTGKDTFCIPYVACIDVPGCPDCDPYETVYVLSKDAKAYAAMNTKSPVVARLSYDVLQMDYSKDVIEGWMAVGLPGGGVGYVTGPDFRTAVDYRALLRKRKGVWQIDVFVAGD